MKKIYRLPVCGAVFAALLFCGCGEIATGGAEASAATENKNNKEENMNWYSDFDLAAAAAKKENKPIFMLFTGSDWCPWCMKLDGEILSKPEFENYAKDNLVMLYLDFPNAKQQTEAERLANRALAVKFGVEGYPTVVLLSADGRELGRTGYQRGGAVPFVESLKAMQR
ncbi:MAG: thioredoxin family protein [Victivallaceae bacterium]|nr:thioredoxin family protein [Victivallaceae bacterium]